MESQNRQQRDLLPTRPAPADNMSLVCEIDPDTLAQAKAHIESSSNGSIVSVAIPERDPLVEHAYAVIRRSAPEHIKLVARYLVAYLEGPVIIDPFGEDLQNQRRQWKRVVIETCPSKLRSAVVCLLKNNKLSGNALHKAISIILEYTELDHQRRIHFSERTIAAIQNLFTLTVSRAQGKPLVSGNIIQENAELALLDTLCELSTMLT